MSRSQTQTQTEEKVPLTARSPTGRSRDAAADSGSSGANQPRSVSHYLSLLRSYFQDYFDLRLDNVTAIREAYNSAVGAAGHLEEYLRNHGAKLSDAHRRQFRDIISNVRELQHRIFEYACKLESSYSILLVLDWRQVAQRISSGQDAVKAAELEAEVKKLCQDVKSLEDDMKQTYPDNRELWSTLGMLGAGMAVGGLAILFSGGLALAAEVALAASLLEGGAVIVGAGAALGLVGLLKGKNDVQLAINHLHQIDEHLQQVRDGLIQVRVSLELNLPEIDAAVKVHTEKLLQDIRELKTMTKAVAKSAK